MTGLVAVKALTTLKVLTGLLIISGSAEVYKTVIISVGRIYF